MASLFDTVIYITTTELTDSTTNTALASESNANKMRLITLTEEWIDNYIVGFCWEPEVEWQARIFPARYRDTTDAYDIPIPIKQACVLVCEVEYNSWLISASSETADIIREKLWPREVEFWNIEWSEDIKKLETVKNMLNKYKCSNFNFTI